MTAKSSLLGLSTLAILLTLAPAASVAAATPGAATGLDLAGMDRSVAPGDNFFAYANGTWLKTAEIPADRSGTGTGVLLTDLTNRRTAELIKQAKGKPGSEARKIGDFYQSYLDEAAIEAKGLAPLKPLLTAIATLDNRTALASFLGGTLRADVDVLNATSLVTANLLGLWVAQDLDNPSRYLPFLLQGGLGMPDRDYYLDPSPRMTEVRAQYLAHVAKVLGAAQVPDAEAKAARIVALERRIAEAHWSRMDTGEVTKGNNHWTRKDFDKLAPGLDWQAFFAACALNHQADFVVWQPSAISGISALVQAEPLDTWKDYLTFHAIERRAGVLPKAFGAENFAFHGKVLTGTPELQARWKRAVDATNNALGEAVGKLYVRRYFPPAEKARAQAMVANILAAFAQRIDHLDWMAPETKAKAKAKLKVLKVGVGYPDRWTDYSGLLIQPGDAFGNAERAEQYALRLSLKKLSSQVDRGEWVMTPQTVNAVNLPAMNAMNFPAAILQPPYFDPRRPAVMDYGATGATIGHEISHSFDDQGALFDAAGRLSNWWTKADMDHFMASADKLARQFDGYRPFPDLAVNGKQTLGENIADVAGLAASFDAYRLSLKGRKAPVVQGFTGDQQFFLSYGQSWREKRREPARRRQIITDGHAPAEYRTFSVRNQDAWYQAFDVKPGQALFLAPSDRVKIW